MRPGEPGVERRDAGLGAEPDDGGQERRLQRDAGGVEGARVTQASVGRQHQQGYPHTGAAEVGDGKVFEHRATRAGLASGDQDGPRREERHQLPEGQEGSHRPRDEYAHKGEQEGGGQHPHDRGSPDPRKIGEGEHENRDGNQRQSHKEEAREAVDPDAHAGSTAKSSALSRRSEEDESSHHADDGHAYDLHSGAHAQKVMPQAQEPAHRNGDRSGQGQERQESH